MKIQIKTIDEETYTSDEMDSDTTLDFNDLNIIAFPIDKVIYYFPITSIIYFILKE